MLASYRGCGGFDHRSIIAAPRRWQAHLSPPVLWCVSSGSRYRDDIVYVRLSTATSQNINSWVEHGAAVLSPPHVRGASPPRPEMM